MAGQSASLDDQDEHGVKTYWWRKHLQRIFKFGDRKSPRARCIYKVSDHIRKSYELEAFTPQVISIGPFHRDNPDTKPMESFKQRCLKSFLDRAEIKLENIVRTIKDEEKSVRECYSETITLRSDEFVNMILVDASFIIEYFLKNKSNADWTKNDREILTPRLCDRIQMDFILLENQLPFFIIKKIYDIAIFPSSSKGAPPFIELTFRQFEYYNVQKSPHSELEHEILHFTDLVRNFCMPPPDRRPKRSSETMKKMHSAAQLYEVGLKFRKRESRTINWSPLELKYEDGVLEIPPFQLDRATEIYAGNLVAFEECHYRKDPYITDYYILLSMLIKTVKDMDLLVREQIIDNCLDANVATSMINKLSGEKRFYFQMNSDYQYIAEKTNKFNKTRRTPLRIMMAALKHEYFRNPWRGAATIGGILLLLLTVIQTVCALISLKKGK